MEDTGSSPSTPTKESEEENPTEEMEETEAIYKYKPSHPCMTSPISDSKPYKESMGKEEAQMEELVKTEEKLCLEFPLAL